MTQNSQHLNVSRSRSNAKHFSKLLVVIFPLIDLYPTLRSVPSWKGWIVFSQNEKVCLFERYITTNHGNIMSLSIRSCWSIGHMNTYLSKFGAGVRWSWMKVLITPTPFGYMSIGIYTYIYIIHWYVYIYNIDMYCFTMSSCLQLHSNPFQSAPNHLGVA